MRGLLAGLIVLVVVAAGYGRQNAAPAEPAAVAVGELPAELPRGSGPRLIVPEELRFHGEIAEGELIRFRIRIAIGGDETLELREIQPGCLCTRVHSDPPTLAPDQRGDITLIFDSAWDGPGTHGEAINFVTNDPRYGETRPPLAADRWVFFDVTPAPETSVPPPANAGSTRR